MRYYPINLDVNGRLVVVVGGGVVASRKARRLFSAGALLKVITPQVEDILTVLAVEETVTILPRPYSPGDLEGALLVIAATDDPAVNAAVAAEARQRGILVNVTDDPTQGDFTTPALLERGDLQVAVSTGGASPSLSRRILQQLEDLFGPEYGEAVALLGAVREKILTVKGGNAYNERVFSELAELDLPELIRSGNREVVDQILSKLVPGVAPGPDGAEKKDPQ